MNTEFDVVLKEIRAIKENIVRAMSDGSARDFAEYKFLCGEIQGLSLVQAYIEDLVRQLEFDDE
jgi:hypothetical protein